MEAHTSPEPQPCLAEKSMTMRPMMRPMHEPMSSMGTNRPEAMALPAAHTAPPK